MEEVSDQGEGGQLQGDQDQELVDRLKYQLRLAVRCRRITAMQLESCELTVSKLEHKIKELENVI